MGGESEIRVESSGRRAGFLHAEGLTRLVRRLLCQRPEHRGMMGNQLPDPIIIALSSDRLAD